MLKLKTPSFWQDRKTVIPYLLLPIAFIYQIAATISYKTKSRYKAKLPVICVGNAIIGGAGKTPVAIEISRIFLKNNLKPVFLSRGYGASITQPIKVDLKKHSYQDVGDEPLLLAKTADVYVCSDKIKALKLIEKANYDVVIMDDGLQNPAIIKDYSILVINGEFGFGNRFIFPAGPLRESVKSAKSKADISIIVDEDKQNLAKQFANVFNVYKKISIAKEIKNQKVIAFSGIAMPELFFKSLKEQNIDIIDTYSYPDHYPFKNSDIEFLLDKAKKQNAVLVTTAKDMVRIAGKYQKDIFEIGLELEGFSQEKLVEKILNILGHEDAVRTACSCLNVIKSSLKQIRYLLEGILVKLLFVIFSLLPISVSSAIGANLAKTFGPFLKVHKTAKKNLQNAMPELKDAEVKQILNKMWENLGRTAFEFPHMKNMSEKQFDQLVTVEGKDNLKVFKQEKTGGIFASGHMANWEMAPKTIAVKAKPLALVYRRANNKIVDNIINDTRYGYQTVGIAKGAAGARQILKLLQSKQFIGMLIDQKMNDGIAVPFFGKDAMTAPAIANFALRYKCPVIPVQVIRTETHHFKVIIHKPRYYKDQDIQTIMTELNQMFEDWIRQNPEQWFWVHKRWPKG